MVKTSSSSVNREANDEVQSTSDASAEDTVSRGAVYCWRGVFECSAASAVDWAIHSFSVQLIGPNDIDIANCNNYCTVAYTTAPTEHDRASGERGDPPTNDAHTARTSDGPKHVCDVCGKAFTRQNCLESHRRTHADQTERRESSDTRVNATARRGPSVARADDRPYLCEVCGETFGCHGSLTRHRITHTGDGPFVCGVCGKAFGYQCDLTRHRVAHTGERPFACDVCGKGFGYPGVLTKHRRTHTGERPFVCDVCGKAFGDGSNLTRHRVTHTGARPFVCDVCGKAFGRKSILIKHCTIHTGQREKYECGVCGEKIRRKSSLVLHLRTHMGDRGKLPPSRKHRT